MIANPHFSQRTAPSRSPVAPATAAVAGRSTQITIVICTRERPADLAATLESLQQVEVGTNGEVELLVVENGTRSGAELVVRSFRHDQIRPRYVFESTPGKSHSLNRAIAEAQGSILLFTDDDVRVPRDWIAEMCSPLLRNEGAVVVGGCRLAPHLQRAWMTRYHRGFLASTEYLSDRDPSEFAGVNLACRRDVFSKVGGFDRELGGGGLGNCEDCLLARQLKVAGFTFVSRTQTHVEHHPSSARLRYENWVRAATCVGQSQAYVLHHWQHDTLPCARLRLWYFRLKLALRRTLDRKANPGAEGIAGWELSYRVEIAKFTQWQIERRRTRNYTRLGLHKLNTPSYLTLP